MRRLITGGFVAMLACSLALLGPAAQASSLARSTSCSMFVAMKFHPALQEGTNPNAFIKMKIKLDGCSGGEVTSAKGFGGAIGTIRCHDGRISGTIPAKGRLDWDNGTQSGLNWFFHFDRSLLRGQVVGGTQFLGEHIKSVNFTLTPHNGDCSASPMIRAQLTGTLGV